MDTTETLRSMFCDPEQYSFHLAPVLILPKHSFETNGGWRACQLVHEKNVMLQRASEDRIRARLERFDAVFSEHPRILTGTVLDVGGGRGATRRWWTGDGTYIVHDPGLSLIVSPPTGVGWALNGDGYRRPVTFVVDFGERLPYRQSLFDVVVVKETLDHCLDPHQLLRAVRGVLRADGRLIVINHFGSVKRTRRNPLKLMKSLLHSDHHLRHFTPHSLNGLAKECGFDVEKDMVLDASALLPNHYVGFWRPAAPH